MSDRFFDRPILNSPYEYPSRHWELDETGQPTSRILDRRRRVSFITPIPKPKKRGQREMDFDEAAQALETDGQQYQLMEVINALRRQVDAWRSIPDPGRWRVTPETARLLQHWRNHRASSRSERHRFNDIRPFFCQVEAAEAAIWLTEVAPALGNEGRRFLDHLAAANEQANPGLSRLALKLATGAGKTTVMAMLIAWQTVNAVRRPGSRRFTRGFLVVAPGLTIRDRLRVLQPNDPDSYYQSRELVPADMFGDLDRAKIVITNYHAFMQRESLAISKGGRALLQGRGPDIATRETAGQMLQRVVPDLMGMKNILVLNDEAHHCYREKPSEEDEEGPLKGDDRTEAQKNKEAARVWISGLETVRRKLGIGRVLDLSATPFFLRGSGYAEGTLFPWTVSDFSLMDAIESGIVKLPRVPVADNIPNSEMPTFRNLWHHIGKKMPKKGRGKAASLDPLSIPVELQTALEALYGHYARTFELWQDAGIEVPPCFIVVCNNTSTSKLVHDFVSGFQRENEDGSTTLEQGRLALFRNFDEHGNPLARPRTLLIDSEQLESGQALDKNFRAAASDEIERFRSEISHADRGPPAGREPLRSGPAARGHEHGRKGGPTRRRHPLRGVRLDADRRLGCQHRHPRARGARLRHPTPVRAGHRPGAAPAILRPERRGRVRRRVRRRARHPVRLHGPSRGRAAAAAARDGPGQGALAGARCVRDPISARAGVPRRAARGAAVGHLRRELDPGTHPRSGRTLHHAQRGHRRRRRGPEPRASRGVMRPSTVVFHLTKRLLETKWRDPGEEPKLHLFGQLKRITRQWLKDHLVCKGGTYPAQLMYQSLADTACERITRGIVARHLEERPVQAVLDPYNPVGSSMHVRFTTSKKTRWETNAGRCHVNNGAWGGLRQRVGGRVLPRGRSASAGACVRQEPWA